MHHTPGVSRTAWLTVRAALHLFFQLISRRYERGPMILTSNQSFGAWGEVFGDRVIATAILDRLTAPRRDHEHSRQLVPPEGQAQGWPGAASRG